MLCFYTGILIQSSRNLGDMSVKNAQNNEKNRFLTLVIE